MKYKQLSNYIKGKDIPYHNYWETMHIKRIVLGEYNESTYFKNSLLEGFMTIMIGTTLLRELERKVKY